MLYIYHVPKADSYMAPSRFPLTSRIQPSSPCDNAGHGFCSSLSPPTTKTCLFINPSICSCSLWHPCLILSIFFHSPSFSSFSPFSSGNLCCRLLPSLSFIQTSTLPLFLYLHPQLSLIHPSHQTGNHG